MVLFVLLLVLCTQNHWLGIDINYISTSNDVFDAKNHNHKYNNIVTENAFGVGEFGGSCTCPNGKTYFIGVLDDSCKTLACYNAERVEPQCFKYKGTWSYRQVICGPKNIDIYNFWGYFVPFELIVYF